MCQGARLTQVYQDMLLNTLYPSLHNSIIEPMTSGGGAQEQIQKVGAKMFLQLNAGEHITP